MSEEFFWNRRIHILNTLLFRTQQEELSEIEQKEMVKEWEDTFINTSSATFKLFNRSE